MGGGAGGMPPGAGAGERGRGGSPEHHFAMPPHLSITQRSSVFTVDITMPDGKHIINTYTAGEKKCREHHARHRQPAPWAGTAAAS